MPISNCLLYLHVLTTWHKHLQFSPLKLHLETKINVKTKTVTCLCDIAMETEWVRETITLHSNFLWESFMLPCA